MSKSSIYMIKELRRKNDIVEHNLIGTDIWAEIDDEIRAALHKQDFHARKDGTSGWISHPSNGYDYCLINLRD